MINSYVGATVCGSFEIFFESNMIFFFNANETGGEHVGSPQFGCWGALTPTRNPYKLQHWSVLTPVITSR